MKDEQEIREEVSNCFNANHGFRDETSSTKSAYQLLAGLLETYELDHWDAESLAYTIEGVVAEFIMDSSPKFNHNDEEATA